MPSRIGDALRWYAKHKPQQTAIVEGDHATSYAVLWSRACRLVDGLKQIGVKPNDRIAVLMQNSAAYIELYQAAAMLGVAVVPLNFRFVASEIEYVVNHSGASALIYDEALASLVGEVRSRLTSVGQNFIVVGNDGANKTYEGLIASGKDVELEPSDLNACFFQGYTSGTTGFPKGCVNPHREFADCMRRMATVYAITENDIELVPAPLFHEAPALFCLLQIFRGGTVVVTKETDPDKVLKLVQDHKVTWMFMVPTMWAVMAASDAIRKCDLSSLRHLISGGSPLHTLTKEQLIALVPNAGLNEFYGATEAGLISNLGPEDQKRKLRSVGRPIPGMYVELRDEDGKIVPQGEVGEIFIGGATLLREYFNNPEATKSSRSGTFLRLGDMGKYDEEGYLYIVDRKKDMIISGGENIFPNDIEDVIYQHPAVNMAAVVGAPDPKWGEIVVAVVSLKPGQDLSESELIEFTKTRLSSFKVPKRVEFMPQLPLSSFGKILRREVRAKYWEKEEAQV